MIEDLFEHYKQVAAGNEIAASTLVLAHVQTAELPMTVSVRDAARHLGVSDDTIYELCSSSKIRHLRVGNGRGVIRIPRAALAEYVGDTTQSPKKSSLSRHF